MTGWTFHLLLKQVLWDETVIFTTFITLDSEVVEDEKVNKESRKVSDIDKENQGVYIVNHLVGHMYFLCYVIMFMLSFSAKISY